jgi:hypothetical protein
MAGNLLTAVGIRTADPRQTLQIVAAAAKPLADLPDTLKAIPAVGGGVPPIVTVAEVGEMAIEDGVELIATTRNVLVPRRAQRQRPPWSHQCIRAKPASCFRSRAQVMRLLDCRFLVGLETRVFALLRNTM